MREKRPALIWSCLGEDYLRRSELSYPVVRPPQLLDEPGFVTCVRLQQGEPGGPGRIPREDLAAVMIEAMTSAHTLNTTFEIVRDPSHPAMAWRTEVVELEADK